MTEGKGLPPEVSQKAIEKLTEEASQFLQTPSKGPTIGDHNQIEGYVNDPDMHPVDFALTPLPPEIHDHLATQHLSPLADEKLTGVAERMSHNPGEAPTFYDLQQIIHAEREDIRLQNETYAKDNPEWVKKRDTLVVADNYFAKNPDQNEVDISISLTKNHGMGGEWGDGAVYVFNIGGVGKESYRLKRDDVADDFKKYKKIATQPKMFEEIEKTASDMMLDQPITIEEKKGMLIYLESQMRRWALIKEQVTQEGGDRKQAGINEVIVNILLRKVGKYPTVREMNNDSKFTEKDFRQVEDCANDKALELKPLTDEVIAEAETITKDAAPKVSLKKSESTRDRQQPPA